ncbi:MAG: UvrD-helicase domain-containing protein [Gemmatimonadota bacterium]
MAGPQLNAEQHSAVQHGLGPLLVLAGAGSGKTRVLTARVARLIEEEGVAPHQILAMTFTNKAAGVMRDRIADLIGGEPRGLWVGTFHSIAARVLRRESEGASRTRGFTIYDSDDTLRVIRRAMEEAGLDTQRWSPQAIRGRISDAKSALVTAPDYSATAFNLMSKAVASVYPIYERMLVQANAYDFDDLLLHTALLLENNPPIGDHYADRFLHILVDEYQDTNHAQYRIVRRLAEGHGNVCVVGDDDQSIYGWRGADVRNILDFERDFPGTEVVRLEQNYRSSASIIDVANAVIALNRSRKEKRLRTERGAGDSVVVARLRDEKAEAKWVVERFKAFGVRATDCTILYRTNAQSRPLEEALRRVRIPYRVVGGVRFYERREIKDVLSYLLLTVNPADETAFGRAVSWPRRGIGSVTLERLRDWASAQGVPLLAAAERAAEIPGLPPAGARALVDFAAAIAALRNLSQEETVEAVLRECLSSCGLIAALESEDDGEDRLANVTELLAATAAFDPSQVEDADAEATDLELYLQSAALQTDADEMDDSEDCITMMTIHSAKGLEFPVVFLVGLEDGLFPLARASESEEELEEERRLFYVGVTRAEDHLLLSHADRRWRYGAESRSAPSPFLQELPDESVRRVHVGGRSAGPVPAYRAHRPRQPAPSTGAPPETRFSWRRSPGRDSRPGPQPAGVRYDFGDTQEPLRIEPGARVVHPHFGSGEILTVSGHGTSVKADIEFEGYGTKRVVVAHAHLRPE